jgi:hypothetical protein
MIIMAVVFFLKFLVKSSILMDANEENTVGCLILLLICSWFFCHSSCNKQKELNQEDRIWQKCESKSKHFAVVSHLYFIEIFTVI